MAKILSIVTTPGTHSVSIDRMAEIYGEMIGEKEMVKKMKALIRAGPVRQKHCFLPDFLKETEKPLLYRSFSQLPTTAKRMEIYKELAYGIADNACRLALQRSQTDKEEITHLITFSCTGLYAPGLEFELYEGLGLNPFLKKFTVNYMGCHAAFHALRLAHLIIENSNQSKVLLVGLEICSLHLSNNKSDDNLLANYLFSDGCAACVLGAEGPIPGFETLDFQSTSFAESKGLMAWDIGNLGFEMKLDRKLPSLLKKNLNAVLENTFQQFQKDIGEIDEFAIHPGGKNILTAFEEALYLPSDKLYSSRETLAQYGNMSSVTVLFVLEALLNNLDNSKIEPKNVYAAAFGPGISLESALIRLC